MKKFIRKHGLLLLLFFIGAGTLTAASLLYATANPSQPGLRLEFAKALLTLGMSAIVGGFIKLLFDENQKRLQDEEKRKVFAEDLLNRLRKIFDAVDGARRLIKAHRSAKTYGERIREDVIPSIVGLYDIKRSLKDSENKIPEEKIRAVRIYCHYMIAYLQELADEYETSYFEISNYQLYEEEWKTQAKQRFVRERIEKAGPQWTESHPACYSRFPEPKGLAWQALQEMPATQDYIRDDYGSAYRKMFVNFYEYGKRVLKGQTVVYFQDCWYDQAHFAKMLSVDERIRKGETLTPQDSMVTVLQAYLRGKLPAGKSRQKHETLTMMVGED